MLKSKPRLQYLFFLYLIFTVAASLPYCIKGNDNDGTCKQCQSEKHLYDGKCYDRVLRCDQHQLLDQKTMKFGCKKCLNGYVVFADGCKKAGFIKLENGMSMVQINQNKGIASSTTSEFKQNITSNANTQPQVPVSAPPPQSRPLPTFPEIQMLSLNQPQSYELQGKLKQQMRSMYPSLVQASAFRLNMTENQFLLVYSDGSLLYVTFSKEGNKFSVAKIGNSTGVRNYIISCLSYKYGELASAKITLDLKINQKEGSAQPLYVNMPLTPTQNFPVISKTEGSEKLPSEVKKNYEKLLPIAYSQYLNKTSFLNIPQKITEIRATQNQNGFILYKIFYASEVEEFAQFKYRLLENSTQVLGYFIEGSDIFAQLNKANSQANNSTLTSQASSPTSASSSSGMPSPSPSPAQTQTQTNSQIPTPSFPASIPNPIQNNANSNANSTFSNQFNNFSFNQPQNQNSLVKIFGFNNSLSSIMNSTGTSTQVSLPPTPPPTPRPYSDLSSYIQTKPQFLFQTASSFKPIPQAFEWKINSQTKSEIKYTLKFLVIGGTLVVTVVQNTLTKSMVEKYQVLRNREDTCMQLNLTDTSLVAIDGAIKKAYPFSSTDKLVSGQLKIDNSTTDKFLMYYASNQYKRQYFEIAKSIQGNTTKLRAVLKYFNITLDSNYVFQKKQYQNLTLQFTQVDLNNYINAASSLNSYVTMKNNYVAVPIAAILNELKNKYKPFLDGTYIYCVLANGTHAKLYAANRLATYEYLYKYDDPTKASLSVVDTKFGYEVWPLGAKKGLISNMNSTLYQKLQQSTLKKHGSYFSQSTSPKQLYIKKQSQTTYDIAFKTIFGHMFITATLTSLSSPTYGNMNTQIALGPMKLTSELEQSKIIVTCKQSTQYLEVKDKVCYKKIISCYRQIGNLCVVCQGGFVLEANMRECRRACGVY